MVAQIDGNVMKLHSETPFWHLKSGIVQSYPHLTDKRSCDVVVVGAGITGALIADRLVQHGLDVVVLDSRDVGCGSTSASTALLQYEIDTSLRELQRLCGPVANDLYRSGISSIRQLKSLSEQLDCDVEFRSCPSCYLAASYDDAEDLQAEAICRQAQRIAVEYWDEQKVRSQFDFPGVGALWSFEAAQVNPYLLTHALLRNVSRQGALVYDRSPIVDLEHHADGVTFQTESGSVFGRFGIIAAGYESQAFLPKPVAKLTSTFAFVQNRSPNSLGGPRNASFGKRPAPISICGRRPITDCWPEELTYHFVMSMCVTRFCRNESRGSRNGFVRCFQEFHSQSITPGPERSPRHLMDCRSSVRTLNDHICCSQCATAATESHLAFWQRKYLAITCWERDTRSRVR